jgi:PAS domain S-box-containing protein
MGAQASSDRVLPSGALPAALDALPYGIVVIDRDERVMYANEPARRLAADDLRIGETARWASIEQPSFDERAQGGEDEQDLRASAEVSAVTISGALGGMVRPTRVRIAGLADESLIVLSPLPDSQGRGHDPERLLREVEAVSKVGSWSWDVEADVVTLSDELFRLHGLVPQSLPATARTVARQYHPEDRSAQFELVDRCRRTGLPFENTHRIVRPDATERWLQARGQAVMEDGRTVRIYGTVEDITERVEREQALRLSLDESRRLAAENESLRHEVEAQLSEVRRSRSRIVRAGYETRRVLERDLHDGAQQRLTTVGLILRSAQGQLPADASPALGRALDDALVELQAGLSELRAMARGLHPAILSDEGLLPALEALVARSAVPARLSAGPLARLPGPIETTAYLVVSEALTNAGRRAAASTAEVTVELRDETLVVTVSDDGVGGARIEGGSSLRVLADRVAALDGRLQINSPAGGGTRLRAELPCA